MSRWSSLAHDASALEFDHLRQARRKAVQMRGQLTQVIDAANRRLKRPLDGSLTIPAPPEADWSWRPEFWCEPLSKSGWAGVPTREKLSDELTVFHDCSVQSMTIRQIQNTTDDDFAPYALGMDVLEFQGSFLSVVIDTPATIIEGLSRRYVVRMDAQIELERPIEIFARLNIKHGPNTEQIVSELSIDRGGSTADFDLAYVDINEQRLEAAWIDLIFSDPAMSHVLIRDLTLCRYPRAEL